MQFQVNMLVSHIDSNDKGRVVAVNKDKVTVLLDNGFENIFNANELCEFQDFGVTHVPKISDTERRDEYKRSTKSVKTKKTYQDGVYEIDIHIEKLVEDYLGLSNYEILEIQEDRFFQAMEFVLKANLKTRNRYHSLVVIHGVGEGVLKERIRKITREKYELFFDDASYVRYSRGATEIFLNRN